jgi:hypothetical protein
MRDEQRLTSRAYWVLIMFVTLQIADIASTNYALAIPGVWEANPLMAFAQAELGTVWWLPKLAAAGVVSAAALARSQSTRSWTARPERRSSPTT